MTSSPIDSAAACPLGYRYRGWVLHTTFRFLFIIAASGNATDLLADNAARPKSQSLAQDYGHGVHSYFAGDYDRSHHDLSSAIQGGIDDPRAWYFRGLAALKLGRLDEAEADFAEGAERESRAPGLWRVAQAMERIQGSDRRQLELHRLRARATARPSRD